jgi:hypothetical protein
MTALLKLLVLLVIFLSASLGDALVNHAQLNHLIRFNASMSCPKNEPSHILYHEPTNDQMNNQMVFGHNELKLNMAFGHSELYKLITTNSNTSNTFKAVNGVNHDHDKIKVDDRMTFKDSRDDEIQCSSREQSKTQSDWQRPRQRSFIISSHVPFAYFRSYLTSGLNCWVHSHTGCETVTSMHGLCHNK